MAYNPISRGYNSTYNWYFHGRTYINMGVFRVFCLIFHPGIFHGYVGTVRYGSLRGRLKRFDSFRFAGFHRALEVGAARWPQGGRFSFGGEMEIPT